MPIVSILEQPGVDTLNTAYRPVVFKVVATRTDGDAKPPVVYCDVYVNGVFYKTVSKTQYYILNTSDTTWYFDIQDACQEVISKEIGENSGTTYIQSQGSFATIFCKFRSSGLDSDGFITSDSLAPIQGTGETIPVSGEGTLSNSFFVVAVVLKHIDNQNLEDHLDSFKLGTWDNSCFPLTHRKNGYRICVGDSDYFPFFNKSTSVDCIRLNYRYKKDLTYTQDDYCFPVNCVAVSFVGNPILPDATVGVDYNYTINLNGTQPFSLGSIIKPSWMTISLIGNQVIISGIPDVPSVAESIEIEIENCSGANSASLIDEIDVIDEEECIDVSFSSTTDLPDGELGVPYSVFISLGGTAPFELENVVKPDWMDIDIVGNSVHLHGTPDEVDSSVSVQFDITNCESGIVSFDEQFAVENSSELQAHFIAPELISQDGDTATYAATVLGAPGCQITVNVIMLGTSGSNTGYVTVNNTEVIVGSTFNATIDSNGEFVWDVVLYAGDVAGDAVSVALQIVSAITCGIGINDTVNMSKVRS